MFGTPRLIQSHAENPGLATGVKGLISPVVAANGGIGFFQNVAWLGWVCGYVEGLLRGAAGGANTTFYCTA